MSKSRILLKVTGSIAAYKACYLTSKLVQAGYDVKVSMSKSALNFIGESSFEGLTGTKVYSDTFASGMAMEHIHLDRWADLIIVCPATSHFINRIAHGIGDDLLSTLFLAHDFKKPYLIAPAMNTSMYLHPTTQDSLRKLKTMGVTILETASGVLACGESGWGKLLDPELIFSEIETQLKQAATPMAPTPTNYMANSLKKVLITSGGTIEPLDQVRSISNFSTGETGAQLADQLNALGFSVTHLRAQAAAEAKSDVSVVTFKTFKDLQNRLTELLSQESFDHVIHLAAVSDFSVDKILDSEGNRFHAHKIDSQKNLTVVLKPNPKLLPLLKTLSKNKNIQVIGFKLTSEASTSEAVSAVEKTLSSKDVDFVVHNDLSHINRNEHHFTIYQGSEKSRVAEGTTKSQMQVAIARLLLEGGHL